MYCFTDSGIWHDIKTLLDGKQVIIIKPLTLMPVCYEMVKILKNLFRGS